MRAGVQRYKREGAISHKSVKKGISPIIAVVLLFAVTVSVAGIFANFAPNLVKSLTQGTQQQAETQIQCEGAGLSFEGVNYDDSGSTPEATYVLRNNGNTVLSNVTVVSFNSDGTIIEQSSGETVYTGNLTEITHNDQPDGVGAGTEPDFVQAFSRRCGSIEVTAEL